MLAQPLALGLGALLLFACIIGGGSALIFWMVVAIRLSDNAINTILARPALQILFQTLPLRGLFADPDPAVRRAVVLAAGQISNTRLVGYQIAALTDRSTAVAATRSLERTRPMALPALTAAFAKVALPEKILIATILGRISGEPAIANLRGAVSHPDAELRSAACAGLAVCGYLHLALIAPCYALRFAPKRCMRPGCWRPALI